MSKWAQKQDTGPCRCGGCNERFNRLYTFDGHRVGRFDNRRCLTTDEMLGKGWSKNEQGRWTGPKGSRVHVGWGKWAAIA